MPVLPYESFVKRYNSDLANDFGNLLSRVTRLIEKNFDGIIPDPGIPGEMEKNIQSSTVKITKRIHEFIDKMKVNNALEETMKLIRNVNRYMEQQAPWKLVKEDKSAAGRVLYTAAESLRIGAVLLSPVMPNRVEQVLDVLNTDSRKLNWGELIPGTELKKHSPLFPRIDVKKEKQKTPVNKTISMDDFKKLGLKTAEIISVEKVKNADKLLKIHIQLGDEQRQIVSGIADQYSPEELVGKMIIVVSELAPATIRGVESNGMLLAASSKNELSLMVVDKEKVSSGKNVY